MDIEEYTKHMSANMVTERVFSNRKIKRIYLYYAYNKNLSKRECLIEEFSKSKIQKENLKSLQTLIVKRREMDLVPLNFIHSKISLTMHDLISKFN